MALHREKRAAAAEESIRSLKPILFYIFATLFPCFVHGETLLSLDVLELRSPVRVEISIEHAKTKRELTWGLMGRSSLSSQYAMLFHYPKERFLSFWSFNTQIDLDVAFMDQNLVLRDIKRLKSYPERMDPQRPVEDYDDLKRYRSSDPILQFYRQHSVHSPFKTKYVLEMRADALQEFGMRVGDRLLLSRQDESKAWLVATIDVGSLNKPSLLSFPEPARWAFWQPRGERDVELECRDAEGKIIQILQVPAGAFYSALKKPVVLSVPGVKEVLVRARKGKQ